MSIEITFIRHAMSCGNVKDFAPGPRFLKVLMYSTKNPNLSTIGLWQIKQAKHAHNIQSSKDTLQKYLNNMDYVFSSDMLRAMETAYRLFPDKKIQVIPYVSEFSKSKLFFDLGLDWENKQQDYITTLSRLEELGYDTSRFNYDIHQHITSGDIVYPNWEKFLKEIVQHKWLNPQSKFYLGKNKKIAIVTHGHYMRDIINKYTIDSSLYWQQTPYFQSRHCQDIEYKSDTHRIGNVGMFSIKFSSDIINGLIKHKKYLKTPRMVYETNAVYDPEINACLEYDSKRMVKSDQGRLSHVSTCSDKIKNIRTLKK